MTQSEHPSVKTNRLFSRSIWSTCIHLTPLGALRQNMSCVETLHLHGIMGRTAGGHTTALCTSCGRCVHIQAGQSSVLVAQPPGIWCTQKTRGLCICSFPWSGHVCPSGALIWSTHTRTQWPYILLEHAFHLSSLKSIGERFYTSGDTERIRLQDITKHQRSTIDHYSMKFTWYDVEWSCY